MARKSASYKFIIGVKMHFTSGKSVMAHTLVYDIKEGFPSTLVFGDVEGSGLSFHLGLSKHVGENGCWDKQYVGAHQGVDGKWYLPEDMNDSQTIPERIHRKLGELQGGEPMLDAIDENIARLEADQGEDL